MEENKATVEIEKETVNTANTTAKKPVTKKPAAKRTPTAKKAATAKPAAKKVVVKKAETKQVTPKATAAPNPKVVETVAAATVESKKAAVSTMQKVLNTGKKTSKIVTQAGGIILGSSLQTTKAIAGMYSKAGKKALEIGKDLVADTTKMVKENQKTVVDASKTAIKETVETIKDSHIIENPLKKK